MSFDANLPHGEPDPAMTFDPTPADAEPPLPSGVGRGWLIVQWDDDDRDDEVIPGVMIVGDSDLRFEADDRDESRQ